MWREGDIQVKGSSCGHRLAVRGCVRSLSTSGVSLTRTWVGGKWKEECLPQKNRVAISVRGIRFRTDPNKSYLLHHHLGTAGPLQSNMPVLQKGVAVT